MDQLSLTHDHEYIASCSHDSVKFWAVDKVIQARIKSDPLLQGGAEDSDGSSEDESSRKRRKRKRKTISSKKQKSSINFFADL